MGECIFIQDGKVCKGFTDFLKGTPWWSEVSLRQNVLLWYILLTLLEGRENAAHAKSLEHRLEKVSWLFEL
jgi:hypothetical protein